MIISIRTERIPELLRYLGGVFGNPEMQADPLMLHPLNIRPHSNDARVTVELSEAQATKLARIISDDELREKWGS